MVPKKFYVALIDFKIAFDSICMEKVVASFEKKEGQRTKGKRFEEYV